MSTQKTPSYDELKQRLEAAESALKAIREGQAHKAKSKSEPLLARLADAEARYTRLAAHIPGVVFQNLQHSEDPTDDEFSYISPGIRELFGLTPEEVMRDSRALWALIHPEDLAGLSDTIQHAVQANQDWSHEFRVCAADGLTRWVQGAASHEHLADGRLFWDGLLLDITARKTAELALKEALLRNQEAVRASKVGIWDWDLKTNAVQYSAEWKAQVGYEEDEIGGGFAEWESRVHPDDLSRTLEQVKQNIRNRSWAHHLEFRFRHKDGSYRWILAQATVMCDSTGEPVRVIGSHFDITEHKQAELALRESEERYRRYIESSPNGVFVCDEKGRYLEVNPAACQITGYSQDELTSMSIAEILFQEDRAAGMQHFESLVREGASYGELPYRHRCGERRWWSVSAAKLADDRFLGFCVDLTERKEAEQALRYSENLFRRVFELLPVGLWIADKDGRLLRGNPAGVKIWGAEPHVAQEEYGAFKARRLPSGEEVAPEDWALAKTVKEGLTVVDELLEIDAFDGVKRVIVNYTAPVTDESGNVLAAVVVNRDITDQYRAEAALQDSERKYRLLADNTMDIIWLMDMELNFVYVNPAIHALSGYSVSEWVGTRLSDHCEQDAFAQMAGIIDAEIAKGPHQEGVSFETEMRRKDGTSFPVEIHGKIIFSETGAPVFLQGVTRDISERKLAENELKRRQRFLDLHNRIVSVFLNHPQTDIDAAPITALDEILRLLHSQYGFFGYINEAGDLVCPTMTREIWDQCQVADKSIVFPRSGWGGLWGKSLLEKRTLVANEHLTPPSGHVALENALAAPIIHRGTLIGQFVVANKKGGYNQEDRELLEAAAAHTAPILFAIQEDARQRSAHEKLEAQLRQALKMEAVGRLAGGVAHDFNNMLSVVIGHTDMILDEMLPEHPLYEDLQEIRQAGERSADLTRQLLAFARKQTVTPKVIDVNNTLESMLKMLQRLIGEDIQMAWIPGEKVWPVKIDPGQIDQILANLCVNARDAIDGVGKVIIETGNAAFDEGYCKEHAEFIPGEYAMLAVSDTGCGIDADTLSHLFEPFYTTKSLGKGTGLGLAMVYGVVKQNNGLINVYSEPGQGTTFKIYLPRYSDKASPLPIQEQEKSGKRGNETILLVEDEPSILKMTYRMLQRQGYTVLGAATPGEAVRLATEHPGEIHLLMTDVVMPEMNGRDLAKNLLSLYPSLKCLFMSGYTANVIAHHGVLEEGVNFIQKPFSKNELTLKVREVLDHE